MTVNILYHSHQSLVTPLSLKSPLPVVMHLCCNPLSLANFDVHVHTHKDLQFAAKLCCKHKTHLKVAYKVQH